MKVPKTFQSIASQFVAIANENGYWASEIALCEDDFTLGVRGFLGKAATAGFLQWSFASNGKMYWKLTGLGMETAYRKLIK